MVRKTRYALKQLEGRRKSLEGERVAFRWGVALRAALSAAPEPRLRRVSAIRLQSLTQKGGGCGDLARAPSTHSSLRGLASITCFRLMRVARYQDLNSQARKARDARSTAGPSRSHRVSRAVLFGIANDGITKARRQWPALSPMRNGVRKP